MDRLLRPGSVAIVGATPTPGAFGAQVMANLIRARYAGTIYLVNPKYDTIHGRACLSSIDDLPEGLDCVVLAIPRAGLLAAVAACTRRRAGSAILFAAGFADAGEAGRVEQLQLREIADRSGMLLEGPNCLGLVNYVDGIPLTFVLTAPQGKPVTPGIAVVSQSGAMAAVLGVSLRHRELPLSYSVTTGNEATCGVEEFLDYMVADNDTRVIALVVEQFRKPQALLRVAEKARSAGKRIVLLHPGSSRAARASAATHTGALAGDYRLMRARVEHAGIVVVDSLEELIDVTDILWRCPAFPAGGTAVFTESGAFQAMALDLSEQLALPLAVLGDATLSRLRAVLPGFIPAVNPFDITAHGLIDNDLYRKSVPLLLADEKVGSLVLTIILTDEETSELKFRPLLAALRAAHAAGSRKPVVFAGLDEGAVVDPASIRQLRELGVPYFASPERAFRALAQVARHAARQQVTVSPQSVADDLAVPAGTLTEYKSKLLLQEAAIPIPPGELATTVEEAVAIAGRIGFPVALKAQSAQLPHKEAFGGVALRLGDADAVREAWTLIHASLGRPLAGLQLDGMLVERMAAAGVELIVGARVDADWGPVLLVGLGGVFAEALGDTRLLIPGLAREAIVSEILQLKGSALLRGPGGAPALDVEAVADIVLRLGDFIVAHPRIREVDMNPVSVYPMGQGAMALDALIVVGAAVCFIDDQV